MTHYRRLVLDDFGIFQDARLEDLESGLIVVAGPQRAGKTTLMEALRRFGYGIGQGESIPPPSDTYRLDGELVHDGVPYRLGLDGYGDPSLTRLEAGRDGAAPPTVADVFGGLTRDQYRQLYTLGLSQLQRLPPSIDDPEDLSRVLLGAAYGSIADLPEVSAHFDGLAHDIGRKRGHPRYGRFSDAYELIEQGEKELHAANRQVEAHDETQEELDEVLARLSENEAEAAALDAERRRLDTVLQHVDDLYEYRRLGESIAGIDDGRVEAFPERGLERAEALQADLAEAADDASAAREAFDRETAAADPDEHRAELLAIGPRILEYRSEVSGWRERVHRVRETAEALQERRDDLESRVAQLQGDPGDSLEAVKEIETDLAAQDTVGQTVDDVTSASEAVADLEADLAGKRDREAEIESQLDSIEEDGGPTLAMLVTAAAGLLGIAAAIGVAVLVSPVVGAVVGALVLLAGAAVGYHLGAGGRDGDSHRTQLEAQQNTVDQEIAELERRLEEASADLEEAESRLDAVREYLGVGDELSPEGVATFYESVVELQGDIERFERDLERHEDRGQALVDELREVAWILHWGYAFEWDDAEPLAHTDALFGAVDHVAEAYELAVEWDAALDAQAAVVDDVRAFVDEWGTDRVDPATLAPADPQAPESADLHALESADPQTVHAAIETAIDEGETLEAYEERRGERERIRQAIHARFSVEAVREAFAESHDPPDDAEVEAWALDAFAGVADQYADASAIEARLREIDEEEAKLASRREDLQEKRAALNQELTRLASEDDLIEARRKIQEGGRRIERLAEDYATYRIAEYVTEELQDRFIEETTGPLLDEASDIFARITAEYDGIEHTGELADLDFHVLQDGAPVLESSELSRATAEQLFMAVRLARIRQIDTPLPVVVDDALTNFDPAHGARTMALIDDLARTNQVLFLTAHPAFVELAAEHATVDQFWRIDAGRFDGPFADPDRAVTHLQPDLLPEQAGRSTD